MVNLRFTIAIRFLLCSVYTLLSCKPIWADVISNPTNVKISRHNSILAQRVRGESIPPLKTGVSSFKFPATELLRQLQIKHIGPVCFENQRGDRDSFVISGRGGLPSNPSEPMISNVLWQDLRPLPLSHTPEPSMDLKSSLEPIQTRESPPAPVIEAQGWVFSPNGTINLVADATDAHSSEPLGKICITPQQTSEQESNN